MESARQQAEAHIAQAQAKHDQILAEAREQIAIQLAEAREQSEWTKQTVAELLGAAEADAENTRRAANDFSDRHHERARQRVQETLESARMQLAQEAEKHQHDCDEKIRQCDAALTAARAEAERVRSEASTAAKELTEQAEERFNAVDERARRRLGEAESGARAVRENAADHLSRAQDEAREARRHATDEGQRVLSLARAESDEMRSKARAILAEARADVAVLTAQRDEISKQLGDLSGVIDALAVIERPDSSAPSHEITSTS